MNATSPGAGAEVLLDVGHDVGPNLVDEACAVMHAAFAEYADRGQPSGALLETPDSLRAEVADGLRLALVKVDGVVVAMTKYRPAPDRSFYFSRLSVLPASRGTGLASLLLATLRAEAVRDGRPGLSCCVRADERSNIALYEHLGMTVTGYAERASLTSAILPVVLMADRDQDSPAPRSTDGDQAPPPGG